MHGQARRSAPSAPTPRFSLRFDRGHAQLALGAPLDAGGVRVDSLVLALDVARGPISLIDGWRAFRHRRTSLVEARVSIAHADLARRIEAALGGSLHAETSLAATPDGLSVAVRSDAQSVAAEVTWGWEGADLLFVLSEPRAFPRGPRGPLATAHDVGGRLSLRFDEARGALRLVDPLRWALAEALLPAGLRIPITRGIDRIVRSAPGRVVLDAALDVGVQAGRAQLEAARALSPATDALLAGDLTHAAKLAGEHIASGDATTRARAIAVTTEAGHAVRSGAAADETSSPGALARELATRLEDPTTPAGALVEAALGYARREPHGGMAADALLRVAHHTRALWDGKGATAALARAALGRLPVAAHLSELDVDALAGAIDLAFGEGPRGEDEPTWDAIARALGERIARGSVRTSVARAHALALARLGEHGAALDAFRGILRVEEDATAAAGVARALVALGRWEEALSAWDRVQTLCTARGEHAAARAARLHAAHAAEAAGRFDAAIARLRELLGEGGVDLDALVATSALAARLTALGRAEEAAAVDRGLPSLVDALGPAFAIESRDALALAVRRSLAAGAVSIARASLDALHRLLGEVDELEALTRSVANAEGRALVDGTPETLRLRADALRREGRDGEAARVLVELFARTGDAAVLRAAVELAERSGDAETRAAVLDRALDVLPPGAARDALTERRRS